MFQAERVLLVEVLLQVLDAARGPLVWHLRAVVHDAADAGADLPLGVVTLLAWVLVDEVVLHAQVVPDLMSDNLKKIKNFQQILYPRFVHK